MTRDHRSHSGSYCVCGTWDFAHTGARRLTLKSHPATTRGGRKLTDSPKSSLVSSQGVSSPTLPNGCGRELIGLSLHRDQKGKASSVTYDGRKPRHEGKQGERTKRPPLPSPLGLRRGQGPLRTSGCPSRRTPGILVPVNCNTRRQKRQYVDAGPPCQRRTRWLAGPASVTS